MGLQIGKQLKNSKSSWVGDKCLSKKNFLCVLIAVLFDCPSSNMSYFFLGGGGQVFCSFFFFCIVAFIFISTNSRMNAVTFVCVGVSCFFFYLKSLILRIKYGSQNSRNRLSSTTEYFYRHCLGLVFFRQNTQEQSSGGNIFFFLIFSL